MLYREIIAACSQIHTKHINTLCGQNVEFLGVFASLKMRLLIRNVRLSVHLFAMYQSSSHWTDFHKFDTGKFYEIVQNLIKIGQKISGIVTWRPKEAVLLPSTQTRNEISFCAKLNIVVLLTVIYSSTTHIKCIVVFPFQQWLGERATINIT
jgi:hypothetical protein